MKAAGLSIKRIMTLWLFTFFATGLGALIGAAIMPVDQSEGFELFVKGMEGFAAGAMLTMIAQTMLPEAFHQVERKSEKRREEKRREEKRKETRKTEKGETDERRGSHSPLLYVNVGGCSFTGVAYSVRHGSNLTHLLPSSCTGGERCRHFLPLRISCNAAGEDGSPKRQRARNRGRGCGDGGGGRRAHMNPNTIDTGYQSNVLQLYCV